MRPTHLAVAHSEIPQPAVAAPTGDDLAVRTAHAIDDHAHAVVEHAAGLDGAGRMFVLRQIGEAQAALNQAAAAVETLIHQWIAENGWRPPHHGTNVCEIQGRHYKATWKGGSSPRIPAEQARALWTAVAEKLGARFDVDDAADVALQQLLDQAGDLTDDQVRLIARAVAAATVVAAETVRRHTLDGVAAVYPVQTGSAHPRARALADLDIRLDRFQERGVRGDRPSFEPFNPNSIRPATEDQP